jgi:hypothetical protein
MEAKEPRFSGNRRRHGRGLRRRGHGGDRRRHGRPRRPASRQVRHRLPAPQHAQLLEDPLLNRGESPVKAEDPEVDPMIARCVLEKKTLVATYNLRRA